MRASAILLLTLVTGAGCGDAGVGVESTDGPATGDGTATRADDTGPPTATSEQPDTTTVPTGGPGDTTSAGSPCETTADCAPEASPCRLAVACTAGECQFKNLPEGTALPQQVTGDCADEVCDGAGGTQLVPADDPPDDGILCTHDVCDGLVPGHLEGMAPCYTGAPGTAEVGACQPGVQACDARGVPEGPCVGEVVPGSEECDAGLVDEDCDGEVNESGAACLCEPGAVVPCYSGPAGTDGVGACVAGQQMCAASGLELGECADEVVPGEEDCDAGLVDEDCDGETNESGPGCACGDAFLSAGEECDDGNLIDGDGCSSTCKLPVQVLAVSDGWYHTCAVLTNRRVKCWGLGEYGATGHGNSLITGDEPGEMGEALPYTDLGVGVEAFAISVGERHSCALVTGGRVKCWGYNTKGQLGLGDKLNRGFGKNQMGDKLPYVDLGAGKVVQSLSAGKSHNCVVFTDGQVKCWGYHGFGQLGTEAFPDVGDDPGEMGDALLPVKLGTGRTALMVDAGTEHTCVVLDNHTVKCWGDNSTGRLGIETNKTHGNAPGTMGDNLPAINFGVGKTALYVSAGDRHSCAILGGGLVKCWGLGDNGALGTPGSYGESANSMGDNLPVVKLGEGKTAVTISAGDHRTCVLLAGGQVKCWGRTDLGFGGTDIGDQIGEMGDNLPAADLGQGQTATLMTADSGHYTDSVYHTCVVLADGKLKCWGENDSGELGQGDTMRRGDTLASMGDKLLPISL